MVIRQPLAAQWLAKLTVTRSAPPPEREKMKNNKFMDLITSMFPLWRLSPVLAFPQRHSR
jgi:hypothetical protein